MTSIKILGTGCPKCQQTTAAVKRVVNELGKTDVQIEKVEDIMKIMEFEVMSTPAVVLNGVVKIKGRVPSDNELKEMLK